MQVGDVHLQRPRARRPAAVVLLQRAGNHLTLKRLRGVTQIFMRSLWYSLRNRRNFIMLRKMPGSAKSQIRKMDLGEWSIYWALGGQSLEYYAGKYGVFYAHVDRFGAERRQEIRVQDSAS